MNVTDLWKTVLGEIEVTVSRPNFLTWFKNTQALDHREGMLVVQVPNTFVHEWLKTRYEKTLLRLIRRHVPEIKELEFTVGQESKRQSSAAEVAPVAAATPSTHAALTQELQLPFYETVDKTTGLNPHFGLSSFIVGKSNELAYAATKAVSDTPGSLYNPLFLYGGVGLGKTHLLHGVGNEIRERFPGRVIRYISSETFTNELVSAIRNKTTDQFKDRYRALDVLLIDDIQFISGKDRSQEELFHTFNDLQSRSKQVVLSSDRPPKSIPILEDRLRSRFEGGMIADIGYPDFEMRVAFLKQKVAERRLEVSDRVLSAIANLIQRNIRELGGALIRIAAEAKTDRVDMDESSVRRILNQALSASKRTSPKQIVRVVAEFYELDEKDMIKKTRRQEIVRPRQIAMYLLREELQFSYPAIGARFGGRDHTTVIYACNKIEKEIEKKEGAFYEELLSIRDKLRTS